MWGERGLRMWNLTSYSSRNAWQGFSMSFASHPAPVWNSPYNYWWRRIRRNRGYGCQTCCSAGAFANAERSNDYIWNTSSEMEFLNGLEAQLLELRAGNVSQQAGGSCSLYKLLLACSFLSPVLAECKLLRQQAQERHWPVAVCFLFFCVRGFLGRWMWGLSKRSFCQEPVLCCQSETWLMLNHFIGWEGKCSTDHWVARYLSLYLCTLLCFPRAFFPFSP